MMFILYGYIKLSNALCPKFSGIIVKSVKLCLTAYIMYMVFICSPLSIHAKWSK